jgi:trk system potassium uptake protein TrkH
MEKKFLNKFTSFMNSAMNILTIMNFIVLFISPYFFDIEEDSIFLFIYSAINIAIYLTSNITERLKDGIKNAKFYHLFPLIVSVLGIYMLFYNPGYFIIYVVVKQIVLVLRKFILYAFEGKLWHIITSNPAISLMMSFLLVIMLGTFLLMLPISTVANKPMSFVDAFFTATSATCVTGLIVEDTASFFTRFGQLVILILIQIGGLGLMTISTAFALMFGQKLTVKVESVMQNVMGEMSKINLIALLRYIVGITIFFETVGAVFLYFTFRNEFSSNIKAVYYSIFHSVSAFCNAGFALYPDSFEGFVLNYNINYVISLLIIFGGLGFVVYVDLRKNLFKRGGYKRLSLHSKIVLTTTAALLVAGIVGFFISEYNNTMQDMNFGDRLLASFFQSVTCRTAGFNTISQAGLSDSSILLSLALMFIGASPGSTGGGIKTTSFAIMFLAIVSILTGKSNVSAYKRKITIQYIKEAISLIGISLGFLFILLFSLFIVTKGDFKEIVFEAFSAFGTVGLSMGLTSKLNLAGKIIIILLMYLGRIGPLTILYALASRVKKKRFEYLEEKISIG